MSRRRVGSKNRGFTICVAKIMLENKGRAGLGFGDFDGFGDFKEPGWRGVSVGFGL